MTPVPNDRFPQQMRERSYREAMAGARPRRHGIDVVSGRWTSAGGREAARRLIERSDLPTAFFAGADVAALGVLSEFREQGARYRRRSPWSATTTPPTSALHAGVLVTSVDQAGLEMGATAARLLLDRFGGRTEARHLLTEPSVMPRGTTAEPRS